MSEKNEKTIYELFELSILVKALGSIGEMVMGTFAALIPQAYVLHLALLLTQGHVDGDTDDLLARLAINSAHWFAVSNSLLIGVYLFVRGLVQLVLAGALFKNKIWAYPAMLFVLSFLVCTQVYDIYLSHSIPTGLITIVDIVTIYLVWKEYNIVRKARS